MFFFRERNSLAIRHFNRTLQNCHESNVEFVPFNLLCMNVFQQIDTGVVDKVI